MAELGIGADRVVTTTGGLPFFGGPMNSYVVHAIASTVDAVRAQGELGFVHANGGYATKHSCAVYGAAPPVAGFRREDLQAAIDTYPRREVDEAPDGAAVIESYTVVHDRDGPDHALLTALRPDGRRALARSDDATLMDAMMVDEYVGQAVTLAPDGSVLDTGT